MDEEKDVEGNHGPKHGRRPLVEIRNRTKHVAVPRWKATGSEWNGPVEDTAESKAFSDAVFAAVDEAATQATSWRLRPATPVDGARNSMRSFQDSTDARHPSSCAELGTIEVPVEGKRAKTAEDPSCPTFVQDRQGIEAPPILPETTHLRLFLEMVDADTLAVKSEDDASNAQMALQQIIRSWNVPWASKTTFPLQHHDEVANLLKAHPQCKLIREVPRSTLRGMRIKGAKRATEAEVAERLKKMPRDLHEKLLPFQREGVERGIAFRGRVLLADEMGVGKTVQAIAIASCFMEEWPLLIVAPASLRLSWADAIERWLPDLQPEDIHIVRGKRDVLPNMKQARQPENCGGPLKDSCIMSVDVNDSSSSRHKPFQERFWIEDSALEQSSKPDCGKEKESTNIFDDGPCKRCTTASISKTGALPKVVIASYRTLAMLRREFVDDFVFGMMIADESHRLRTAIKASSLAEEVEVAVAALRKARRAVLLTGTPSLSRPLDIFLQVDILWPGLLGRHPRDFGKAYCSLRWVGGEGDRRIRTSGSKYLNELHILLRETIMIRRTKEEVLGQLPPKRRQIVILDIGPSERTARTNPSHKKREKVEGSPREMRSCENNLLQDCNGTHEFESEGKQLFDTSRLERHDWYHSLGKRKVGAVKRWILDALVGIPSEDLKVLIFAHHKDVMDELQNALEELCVSYARIDGSTPSFDRDGAVKGFNVNKNVLKCFSEQAPKGDADLLGRHLQVVLISMKAGGTGLDFHAANIVIFAELPLDPATLFQAEDRAHRRGQKKSVNVYFLCAKGTADEEIWSFISRSTERVSTVSNGIGKRLQGVHIDNILNEGDRLAVKDESLLHESTTNCTTFPSCTKLPLDTKQKNDPDGSHFPDCEDIFFQMSENTARVHFYSRCSETEDRAGIKAALSLSDSRVFVQPLGKNFRVEELLAGSSEPLVPAEVAKLAILFLEEWTALRSFQKHMLSVYALRPPLAELLVKLPPTREMGIRKRKVSLEHVKGALGQLPDGAEWRQVDWICPRRKCCISTSRPFGVNGGLLCSMCFKEMNTAVDGQDLQVERKDLFCGRRCFQAFLHRTSGGTLRKAVFEIEHGICQVCGLDAHKLCVRLRPVKSFHERQKLVLDTTSGHPLCPGWSPKTLDRLVSVPSEGHAWQMDHIIEVAAGGGGCGLENVQTLCVPCHGLKTKEYLKISAQSKRLQKAALECSIQETLQSIKSATDSESQLTAGQDHLSDDDDLIVDVPGIG
eukprot:scaffold116_cov334-Pavlova_lutheri.AAC.14